MTSLCLFSYHCCFEVCFAYSAFLVNSISWLMLLAVSPKVFSRHSKAPKINFWGLYIQYDAQSPVFQLNLALRGPFCSLNLLIAHFYYYCQLKWYTMRHSRTPKNQFYRSEHQILLQSYFTSFNLKYIIKVSSPDATNIGLWSLEYQWQKSSK